MRNGQSGASVHARWRRACGNGLSLPTHEPASSTVIDQRGYPAWHTSVLRLFVFRTHSTKPGLATGESPIPYERSVDSLAAYKDILNS